MIDLNDRHGGPNLIVTAKTADKVHFDRKHGYLCCHDDAVVREL
jgi:hypothetical protein